jgi:hypothetical protein
MDIKVHNKFVSFTLAFMSDSAESSKTKLAQQYQFLYVACFNAGRHKK